MTYESSKAHHLDYCKHFPKGGAMNRVCKLGINIREVANGGAFPCIVSYGCTDKCKSFEPRTEADADAYATRVQEHMQLIRERAENGLCIHCGAAVTRRVQVGRCVYLEPCGHRLGQGKA